MRRSDIVALRNCFWLKSGAKFWCHSVYCLVYVLMRGAVIIVD